MTGAGRQEGANDMTGRMRAMVSVLAVAGSACVSADPAQRASAPANLQVSPLEARAGGEVMLTLENRTASELGYNLCPAVLDRRTADGWEQWPVSPAEICTMELRTLGPESSSSYRHTLPRRLDPGEYRFRTFIEAPLGGDRIEVSSSSFEVVS
jgi:hypothetical protein